MWDTAKLKPSAVHLPHDMECVRCGHAAHRYLPCSDTCTCVPMPPPGVYPADPRWDVSAAA